MVYRRCIAFCGKKRTGKDTLSQFMVTTYGYSHAKFAEPLKMVSHQLFHIPKDNFETDLKDIVDERWGVTPRKLLQFIGTEMMQFKIQEIIPNIGRTFWARNLVDRTSNMTNVVISDLRFPHEVDVLRDTFDEVTVVKISRNLGSDTDLHASEVEVDDIHPDFTLDNNTDIESLVRKFSDIVLRVKRS